MIETAAFAAVLINYNLGEGEVWGERTQRPWGSAFRGGVGACGGGRNRPQQDPLHPNLGAAELPRKGYWHWSAAELPRKVDLKCANLI